MFLKSNLKIVNTFFLFRNFKDEKKLKAEIDDYMKNYDDLKEKVVLKSYLF
jgi:hypothetical protein